MKNIMNSKLVFLIIFFPTYISIKMKAVILHQHGGLVQIENVNIPYFSWSIMSSGSITSSTKEGSIG
jgi:hypothetical protein